MDSAWYYQIFLLQTLPDSLIPLLRLWRKFALLSAHLSGAGHLSLSKMQLVTSRQLLAYDLLLLSFAVGIVAIIFRKNLKNT